MSGEPSTVEHKLKDPFTMRPYATCWFGTNHMPHTRDHSNGLFRRAVILTLNRTFAKTEQDPQLKDKLIAELSGILNLCLAAYADALRSGFTNPASSEAAKNEWRVETDQVAQCVQDACSRDANHREKSSAVYAQYKSWADPNGIKHPVTNKTLCDHLTLIGFGKQKTRDGNWVLGLKLNSVIQFMTLNVARSGEIRGMVTGPEFTSMAILKWVQDIAIDSPGKPSKTALSKALTASCGTNVSAKRCFDHCAATAKHWQYGDRITTATDPTQPSGT